MKKVVILGAAGQVGSEVTLRLQSQPNITLVPVARSRASSAFLRYHGITVSHANLHDDAQAKAVLADADVIASFILARGKDAQQSEQKTLKQIFNHAPKHAKIIYSSTASIYGMYDMQGTKLPQGEYQKAKARSEKQAFQYAAQTGLACYVLRLGHVMGAQQSFSQALQTHLKQGRLVLPRLDQAANVTHCADIAHAIMTLLHSHNNKAGLYDLYSKPRWTWRQTYEYEADLAGIQCALEQQNTNTSKPSLHRQLIQMIERIGVKELAKNLLALHPSSYQKLQQQHRVHKAQAAIAALYRQPTATISYAANWPELPEHSLDGLQDTQSLLTSSDYQLATNADTRWPADILAHND